jgi:hypothetical protein
MRPPRTDIPSHGLPNTAALLRGLHSPGNRLCFYPSCGDRLLSPLLQLKSNVFVFSDYFPRDLSSRRKFWAGIVADFAGRGIPLSLLYATRTARVAKSGDKWILLFFEDNNRVLERIAVAGWKIAQFFSVNDGCMEGGNYECVNRDPCMGRWLDLMENGGDYFTTHSAPLQNPLPWFSPRVHPSFKTHFLHASGARFFLTRLLIRRCSNNPLADAEEPAVPEIFEPPVRDEVPRPANWRQIGEAAAAEIAALRPFRMEVDHGMLAHYCIVRAP